ncbi:MAG: orotidine-5'-phosphate decarboxylase [Chloroflexi bacterium]|uniref:orotidine-5'-phosphate decarboxylase n=1 Tax=Candidatus Flexifilum breve TaxID=3140694 RepID=UPI0031371D7B|nr:orotidine-5'-phosphate decarboxylase [Chloroflexota bacterium]
MNAVEKFNQRADAVNSLVCVGLDSDLKRLPAEYRAHPTPQYAFNCAIIEQTQAYAAAFKINIAFYEARGEAGWREVRETMRYLRERYPDMLTICDAKRGDIGSTSEAYAQAIFDDLGFDAVTLSPYLGREALKPFLTRTDKGCIILCRTSNPGAGEFQDLIIEGQPLYLHVAQRVSREWPDNCMLVVGATYPDEMRHIRALVGDMTFLVPGIGEQGGDVATTVRAGVNADRKGVIINSSRAIIFAADPAGAARDLRDAINRAR